MGWCECRIPECPGCSGWTRRGGTWIHEGSDPTADASITGPADRGGLDLVDVGLMGVVAVVLLLATSPYWLTLL